MGSFGAAAGTRLSPVEWALDTLFYPELAAEYPVFQVQTSEVIHALGLPLDGKQKRDRYSFRELAVGEEQLMELVQRYSAIDEKARTTVQGQIVDLVARMPRQRIQSSHGEVSVPAADPVEVFQSGVLAGSSGVILQFP